MLRDKQEAKFRGVMSVQNTHLIPAFLLCVIFISYINKCIFVIYMILGLLCTIGKYGGFQKLCGDLKKKK